ncbi:MAG: ethanolamine permease [Bacteroidetes bacterium]|nr:ethanolamine permease [Bacteroidota bacterium]
MSPQPELKRTLSPLMVWGLGVGYVISGNYFGWNLGLEKGGTLGMAIALFFIIILYITFTFSYTELACAIPKSGGAFDYARRALGKDAGFITGMAQNIEFIFAPPAIAFAIGTYFNIFFQDLSVTFIAILAYLFFFSINVAGVKVAAVFELVVTALAVIAVLLFSGISFPHFDASHLKLNAFPFGWSGVFAATPFAIWFFLGIEGVANLAEEAINPKRTIMLGFGSAIITLVLLCIITFVSSIGIAGWEAIVFKTDGTTSDSPLPLAMAHIVDSGQWPYQMLVMVGLLGLVASFHGLMLAAGRSTLEFGRVNYAPAFLGKIHPRFQTPANALFINMILGIAALLTGKTGEIITISVFGALTLYILSMISLLKLRKKEPGLHRPFRVPLFPFFPIVALVIASASLVAMAFYNSKLALIYFLILGLSFAAFKLQKVISASKSQ